MRIKHIWKKASFVSIIAMILCISVLVGVTSAWYTISGSSDKSKVEAGEMKVQLLKYDGTDYVDITGGTGDIFNEANGINWEPGRTEVVFLAAKNVGELAMDAAMIMDAAFGEKTMRGALEYALLTGLTKESYDALNIGSWEEFRRQEAVEYGEVAEGQCFVSSDSMLIPGQMQYYVLAVHMKQNSDTSYNNATAILNIKLATTQAPFEEGMEGSDYDENPYPEKEWVSAIGTITFEGTTIEPMTEKEGKPAVIYDESRYESKYVLRLQTGDRAQYSNNSVPQAAGGEYKITGWFKRDNPETVVTVTYWHRVGTNVNEAVTVELKDEIILISIPGGWEYFEIPVEQAANANLAQFILNNHSSTGSKAGTVYFDDLRYMYVIDDNGYAAQDWAEQLADETMNSMMSDSGLDDPYKEREPLSENLVVNGDFSAETGISVVEGRTQVNKVTGWRPNFSSPSNSYINITEEGTLRVEYKVGSNDTKLYRRIGMGLTQTVQDIIPGGVYMVKFDYRIMEKSKDALASWYGPYCYFSSYGPQLPGVDAEQTIDYALVRADGHPDGLKVDGQWHTFTQCVTTSGQAESIGIGMYQWVYEGDSMEIDNVEVYLVDYGPQIALDLENKFFYRDIETTTFKADLKEDVYPQTAADKNANVVFEVFDGKKLIWNTDPVKFAGEGCVASVEFDMSLMSKKGTPYVVRATLYSGDGTKLYELTEDVYVYDRPASLDKDGNYTKLTPDGEKLDFNMAYAIVVGDYEKTKEIGCNVMSLGNSQNAEQTLEKLDQCLKYGYMGFLNMNWGLYNENDISLKRWVMIDVASDERIQNHPSMLGYCIADEPWSWGSEQNVAENLEEGYRLIRQYDKENLIFSVNNMTQFSKTTAKYCDAMFVDHYDSPTNGTIYNKVLNATAAANGKKPVWVALSSYKEKGYFPTSQKARNTIYQSFIAGADGIGWYAITYSDFDDEGKTISVWNVKSDVDGSPIGQELWDGLVSFKEKEWDIAFDHYADEEGKNFNRKVALDKGYMYDSWVDNYGNLYLVVLNTANNAAVDVSIPLQSDDGKVAINGFTATVVNGSDMAPVKGSGTLDLTLEAGNQTILFLIKPDDAVDFSVLG